MGQLADARTFLAGVLAPIAPAVPFSRSVDKPDKPVFALDVRAVHRPRTLRDTFGYTVDTYLLPGLESPVNAEGRIDELLTATLSLLDLHDGTGGTVSWETATVTTYADLGRAALIVITAHPEETTP